jgi:hypothetical protein
LPLACPLQGSISGTFLAVKSTTFFDDDRHTVHECGGGNQRVVLGQSIGHVQSRATHCDLLVNGEDALCKGGHHMLVQPGTNEAALRVIAPFYLQHAHLQLEHRDR